MNAEHVPQRLSQISTAWTIVSQAHSKSANAVAVAQAALVERYQAAVYRYLLAAVRDPDEAAELFQEFALRLVRGDFGGADPSRGRFRDYVRSALINLVINQRKKKRFAQPLDPATVEASVPEHEGVDCDQQFLDQWRAALLDRAWEALATAQGPKGPPFYDVLRYRAEHPELSGTELVEHVNARLQPATPLTDAGLRKVLQRARDKFTDLLIDEVARSLQTDSTDDIEQELIELNLQAHCRRALERRRAGR